MHSPTGQLGTVDGLSSTIHLMVGRHAVRSVCGHPAGHPAHWPAGHLWVRQELAYLVSCHECRQLLPEILGEHKR